MSPYSSAISGDARMLMLEAELAIDVRDMLGEGPAWDAARQRLLWSDNVMGLIHEARADGPGRWRESRQWNLREYFGVAQGAPVPIGSNLLGAAIPRASGGMVVAGQNQILLLEEDGRMAPLVKFDFAEAHMNDAKCDPQGRLWVGTSTAGFVPNHGALFRVDPNGQVTKVLDNVTTSNGPAWSPDETTLYFTDSPTRSVDAFDFDPRSGTIRNRRTFVTVDRADGAPDGMTVDVEGCLWLAVIGAGGGVRRYAPDGTLLARVRTSTRMVTSCAFGGLHGAELFITTAGFQVPEEVRRIIGLSSEATDESGAGGLFVCRPTVAGTPATPFAG